MSIKIDTSELLPDLVPALRKALDEALESHERRNAYRRITRDRAGVPQGYLTRKQASAYIGVTAPTFDSQVRKHIKAVRLPSGTELYSIQTIDDYMKSLEL